MRERAMVPLPSDVTTIASPAGLLGGMAIREDRALLKTVVFRRHVTEGKERIRTRPRSNRSVMEPRVAHCSVHGTPAPAVELDER